MYMMLAEVAEAEKPTVFSTVSRNRPTTWCEFAPGSFLRGLCTRVYVAGANSHQVDLELGYNTDMGFLSHESCLALLGINCWIHRKKTKWFQSGESGAMGIDDVDLA